MNKRLVLLFSILLCLVGYVNAQDVSTIAGKWNGTPVETKVSLFKVADGKMSEISSFLLDSEKRFTFAVTHSEGSFYVVGINHQNMRNKYTFYLKPGDRLNVDIDNIKYTYKLIGNNNSPENIEMSRWYEIIGPIIFKSVYFTTSKSTYVDFFPDLEKFEKDVDSYTVKGAVDKEFERKFAHYRLFESAFYPLVYLRMPRPTHPQGEDYPDFYNKLNMANISKTADLLDYPYGVNVLQFMQFKTLAGSSNDKVIAKIENDALKGEYLVAEMLKMDDYKKALAFSEKYNKYFLTDYTKTASREKILQLAQTSEGADAIDFKFEDKTGKKVSLSDFKGKVVYIDVWATWCGPCLKEAPLWAKLYEEYKSKDIVFLGVSIDATKDHTKWLKHLEKEGEIGVQIFAGELYDDIKRPYDIKGIPHFILIGKDGKILSSKALRPSSPDVRKMLDAALAK